MSSYELEVNGTTYYFANKTDRDKVKNAGGVSEQEKLVQEFMKSASGGKTIVSTDEDDLVEINENEAADESEYPEGYNYESSTAYNKSIGLSALTEDSSVDDLIAVFEQIEEQVNEMDKKIASVDENDPEAIEDLLLEMTNMAVAINELGQKAGAEMPQKGVVGKIAAGVGVGALAAAPTLLGLGGAAAGTTSLVVYNAGTAAIMGTIGAIPVAGQIALGIAAVGLIGYGLYSAYQNHKAEEKLNQLKEDISQTAEKLNGTWDKAESKLQEGGEAVIEDVTKDLDGLLNDEFDFKDITDVTSITDNIDKIIEAQGKLEPFYQVAQTYGIEIEGLDELMDKLGSGDDSLQYAQSYLDAYAEQVDLNIKDEVISDTESLNELYSSIEGLIESSKGKNLKTDKLEALLKTITETNQQEADDTADAIASGDTDGGLGAAGGSTTVSGTGGGSDYVSGAASDFAGAGAASTTADSVQQNSSSYDTSTDSLTSTSEALKKSAQAKVDSYLESISTSGKSIEELEALYSEVSSNYEAFKEISSELNLSGFSSKLQEIKEAQQEQINSVYKEYVSKASSATTTEERKQLLSELQQTISQYSSINLDLSGLVSVSNQIIQDEQTSIEQKAAQYQQQTNQASTSSEATEIINDINVEINNSTQINCDTSSLEAVLAQISSKLDQLIQQETNVDVDVNVNVDPNINVTVDPTININNENNNNVNVENNNENNNENNVNVGVDVDNNNENNNDVIIDNGIVIYNPEKPEEPEEPVKPEEPEEPAPPCEDEEEVPIEDNLNPDEPVTEMGTNVNPPVEEETPPPIQDIETEIPPVEEEPAEEKPVEETPAEEEPIEEEPVEDTANNDIEEEEELPPPCDDEGGIRTDMGADVTVVEETEEPVDADDAIDITTTELDEIEEEKDRY